MNFDELQASWQHAGGTAKSQEELQMMTKLRNHPTLKRIRVKLIVEIVLLTAFVVLYNNAFDGGNKPLWANLILIIGALVFIANDTIGYAVLQRLTTEHSIRYSIENFVRKLQRLSVLSISSSLFFGTAVILFFASGIHGVSGTYLALVGMGTTLLGATYVSYKNWNSRIRHFQRAAEELGETV